jgi:heat shock protein HtpX
MSLNTLKTFFLLSVLTVFFVFIGGLIGGAHGAMIAFGFAVAMNFFSYWFSSSIVLKMYKAKEITEAENPKLYGQVRKLATAANLPMPKVAIVPNPTPNAFATGRNPANGVVAVTTGIMQLLNDEELEGVIAHELAHIGNRDILIGTVAATIAGAVMMLASMAKWGAILGGSKDNNNNIVVALALAIIAPLAASIVQMAVSRTREYEADATAARITRNPAALASALNKISGGVARMPMDNANPATTHMLIMSPFSAKTVSNLFSTHPAVEERIKRLQDMDLGGGNEKTRMMNAGIRTGGGKNPLFR